MTKGDRRGVTATALLAAAGAAALAGCSLITDSFATNDFSGDPFPIQVDLSTGAVMVGLRQGHLPDRSAVLDVLSPVTLVDPGLGEPQSVGTAALTLLGRSAAGGAFDVPRARFGNTDLLSVHPCADETCMVGPPGAARPYQAIVGANVLAGDALRLRLGAGEAFVLADIGGDDRDRTYVCDAVFPAPYRGGGTLLIAGTEVSFGGRRVTLQTCLGGAPDLDACQDRQPGCTHSETRGADALFVMSTGIGVSLLSRTAYERYRQAPGAPDPQPPALEDLPSASVFLPSGMVSGRRCHDRPARARGGLVDGVARAVPPGYAHHLLTRRSCDIRRRLPVQQRQDVLLGARGPRPRAHRRDRLPGRGRRRSDAPGAAGRAAAGSTGGRRHPRDQRDPAAPRSTSTIRTTAC